jgi:predicted DNA-binding ribbon-helix-helix protein
MAKNVRDAGNLVARQHRVHGRNVMVALEPEFWSGFDEICQREAAAPEIVLSGIAGRSRGVGFASAIRKFTIAYFREAALHSTRPECEGRSTAVLRALDAIGPADDGAAGDGPGDVLRRTRKLVH